MAQKLTLGIKALLPQLFVATLGCFLVSCARSTDIAIRDATGLVATIKMTPSHEYQAEYDRLIILNSSAGRKTLPLPPDTGGDLPLVVTRHTAAGKDFLMLKGGIYLLVFDLLNQEYAKGSDSPADEIYTGAFRGETLPPAASEWTIGKDQHITRTR